MNILLVDDDGGNLAYVKGILEAQGHTVTAAYDGYHGLDTFQEKGVGFFDVVISDWHMPRMRGVEMAYNIRYLAPNQKIVMMSSDTEAVEEDLKQKKIKDIQVFFKLALNDQTLRKVIGGK